MFAVSGVMQAMLLVMCIFWKLRQRRLGIDDFGHPIDSATILTNAADDGEDEDDGEGVLPPVPDEEIVRAMMGEDTPLLKHGRRRAVGAGKRFGSETSKVGKWLKGLRRQ